MSVPMLAGAALGLSVAAPFGPVSLICVQQSISRGCRHGVMAGLGAATAHGVFATAAIAGTDAVAAMLTPWANAIRLFSALILVCLGIRTIVRARSIAEPPSKAGGVHAAFASSLILALSNPMTIVPYLAFATVAAGSSSSPELSPWSIPGVVLAAGTWYAGLCFVASALRRGMAIGLARYLNLAAGASLICFGAIMGRDLLTIFAAANP